MSGEAWEKSRRLLAKSYCDLGLVSITGAADEEMSFAADTDMGDAGAGIATQIRCLVASKNMRRLEDGPVGGSPLYFGDDRVGYALDAPLPPAGSSPTIESSRAAAAIATCGGLIWGSSQKGCMTTRDWKRL